MLKVGDLVKFKSENGYTSSSGLCSIKLKVVEITGLHSFKAVVIESKSDAYPVGYNKGSWTTEKWSPVGQALTLEDCM